MIVQELITKLGFRADQKALAKFNKGMGGLRRQALMVGAAIGAAVGAIALLTKSTANYGDKLAKTSQKVGISVEELQKLEFAAGLAGTGFDPLVKGLGRFSRVITDAKAGLATYVRAFDRLDLDPKDFETVDEALLAVADSFKKMDNPITKAAVAQEMFGRAGLELIPLLNKGAEGIKANGREYAKLAFILDDKMTKESEEFNDTLLRIRVQIRSVKHLIGSKLIPVITKYLIELKGWIMANKKLIEMKLEKLVKEMIKGIKLLAKGFIKFGKALGKIIELFGGIERALKIAGIALGAFISLSILNNLYLMVAGFAGMLGKITLLIPAIQKLGITSGIAAKGVAGLMAKLGVVGAIAVSFMAIVDSIRSLAAGERLGIIKWASDLRDIVRDIDEKYLSGWVTKIWNFLSPIQWLVKLLDKAGITGAYVKSQLPNIVQATGGLPQSPGAALAGGGGIMPGMRAPITNTMSIDLTIETPAGANAEDVARAARKEIEDFWGRQKRESSSANDTGVF